MRSPTQSACFSLSGCRQSIVVLKQNGMQCYTTVHAFSKLGSVAQIRVKSLSILKTRLATPAQPALTNLAGRVDKPLMALVQLDIEQENEAT